MQLSNSEVRKDKKCEDVSMLNGVLQKAWFRVCCTKDTDAGKSKCRLMFLDCKKSIQKQTSKQPKHQRNHCFSESLDNNDHPLEIS